LLRTTSAALLAVVVSVLVPTELRADDKSLLSRMAGSVEYGRADAIDAPNLRRKLLGEILLEDDAYISTDVRAAARLQLPDSSIVLIGDRTTALVGAFHAAAHGENVITLNRGAVRFAVSHAAGQRSNYRFITPTAQIAVRGTVGYVVSGPRGVQLYCVDCAPGDVTLTTANETYTIQSGQSINALAVGKAQTVTIVPNASINNPAIDQFLSGFSPFGRPAAEGSDITGSDSGN
jgi:hypothetical protein